MNETPQKPRMIETYRISWSDIAALISEQIKLVLGYKCSLRVWPEDLDFGAFGRSTGPSPFGN